MLGRGGQGTWAPSEGRGTSGQLRWTQNPCGPVVAGGADWGTAARPGWGCTSGMGCYRPSWFGQQPKFQAKILRRLFVVVVNTLKTAIERIMEVI